MTVFSEDTVNVQRVNEVCEKGEENEKIFEGECRL